MPPDSRNETASSRGMWKAKLMVCLLSSLPLFGKYLDRRAVVFLLSCAVSCSCAPPRFRFPVFPPSYRFYSCFSWPPWLFVLGQSCSKGLWSCLCVPGFPASPCGSAAGLGTARGSAHAGTSSSHPEKSILELWRIWKRQQLWTTAVPGRMQQVCSWWVISVEVW